MSNINRKSLLDQAREVPVKVRAPKSQYSREHYELAVALLKQAITPQQFATVMGDRHTSAAIPKAWAMLLDGVAKHAIDVNVNT